MKTRTPETPQPEPASVNCSDPILPGTRLYELVRYVTTVVALGLPCSPPNLADAESPSDQVTPDP